MTVEIEVLDGGEIQSIEQTTKGDGMESVSTIRFSDWGAAVRIAEPTADQVDPTPGLEEEAIAAWKGVSLYMPKAIPVGWALDYADVLPADDTVEGCEQVEIDISPVDVDFSADEFPYLWIYLLPTSCAEDFTGPGVKAFRAGPYSGFVATDGSDSHDADDDRQPDDAAGRDKPSGRGPGRDPV